MLNWYAVQIQSRLGKLASATLHGKGYEEFLPLYRTCRQWSNQVKDVEVPLFPGYLFCRLDPHERLLPVLTTPGVIKIVSFGKTLLPVSEEEIEAVRKVILSGLGAEPCAFVETGCRVILQRGPLAGLEGIVVSVAGAQRLVVSVTLLHRSIGVEMDRSWVRSLPAAPGWHPDAMAQPQQHRQWMA